MELVWVHLLEKHLVTWWAEEKLLGDQLEHHLVMQWAEETLLGDQLEIHLVIQ